MKAGVVIYKNSVAVNFDSAEEILIFDCSGNREILPKPWQLGEFLELIVKNGVNVVICGGIKRVDVKFLLLNGIEVIPWVKGEVESVIEGFCRGNLEGEKFFMPGGRRFRRRWRRKF